MLNHSPPPAKRSQRKRGWLLLAGVILMHGIVLWALGRYSPLSITDPAPLTVFTATVVPQAQGPRVLTQPPARAVESKAPATERAVPAKPASPSEPSISMLKVPASQAPTIEPVTPAVANPAVQAPASPGVADKGAAEKGAGDKGAAEKANLASESPPVGAHGGPAAGRGSGNIELPSSQAAYLQNPRPEYPRISRQRGEQGRVLLRVLIGTDGQAHQTEISKSSGFSRLDQAAQGAVAGWRFVPGKRNGVPEAMWFTVPIGFCLDADGVQCQP